MYVCAKISVNSDVCIVHNMNGMHNVQCIIGYSWCELSVEYRLHVLLTEE